MGVETVDLYCHKHDEIHTMNQRSVEKLIYQYQIRIVEAAMARPLPQNDLTDTPDKIIKNAFCVLEDVRNVIPEWRKHIDATLGRRRSLLRMATQAKHRNNMRQTRRERTDAALSVTRSVPLNYP